MKAEIEIEYEKVCRYPEVDDVGRLDRPAILPDEFRYQYILKTINGQDVSDLMVEEISMDCDHRIPGGWVTLRFYVENISITEKKK